MRIFFDQDNVTKGAAAGFTEGPGKGTYGAAVVQDNAGGFTVRYESAT